MVRTSRSKGHHAAGAPVFSSSYGSCDLPNKAEEEKASDSSVCFSASSSDDEIDNEEFNDSFQFPSNNQDEENAIPKAPSPPPPGRRKRRSTNNVKLTGIKRNKYGTQEPRPSNRRVAFLGEGNFTFYREEAATTDAAKIAAKPALSRNFQDSWRRKSCRRISAIASAFPQRQHQHPKKKTAKDHWAILREHVLSGRCLLDQSVESYEQHFHKTGAVAGSVASTRPSYLHKRHSSIARSLRNEIQSGLEFSLSQCVGAIAVYLLLAVVCFSFLLEETRHEWTMIDSMYFAGESVSPTTKIWLIVG